MTTLPVGRLPALLRGHHRGVYPSEAAVELLIAHGSWLRRRDFLDRCIGYDSFPSTTFPEGTAWVDWTAAAELLDGGVACSSSEERILRLAVELAEPTSLGDLVTGLDDHNQQLVLAAISHAMGNRPPHLTNEAGGPPAPPEGPPVGDMVHVVVRATLALDDATADLDREELVEPLQEATARGLDDQDAGVVEVVSCAVLEILDAP